jgi:hypothetical protein
MVLMGFPFFGLKFVRGVTDGLASELSTVEK